MSIKNILIISILLLLTFVANAQQKSKKQLKEEKKAEQVKAIEELVNSKTFVFYANSALPQGYKTVHLTGSGYTVEFSPEVIKSYLPYYGRAYAGAGYGNDNGMKFEGKPEKYTVTLTKKNYRLNAEVKGEYDTYRLSMTIGFAGNASLNIISNNRSSITYNGEIRAAKSAESK